jgi:uncharacterized 2Fe-2S/4Fe-4S cluster protein (DUF4445 family)
MNITIGNRPPQGDLRLGTDHIVATLFELGVIDKGKFNRDLKTPESAKTKGSGSTSWPGRTKPPIDRDIALTEIDIDNLIRAKGAIYSGFMTLLEEVGMGVGDLDQIIWPAASAATWIWRRP